MLLLGFLYLILVHPSTAEGFLEATKETVTVKIEEYNKLPHGTKDLSKGNDIEYFLEEIYRITAYVDKSQREGTTAEETKKSYDKIVEILQNITHLINIAENAHKFLNMKGVEKIITQLGTNEELINQVLITIKTLFTIDSNATSRIPVYVVDKLLDIFENDENSALKIHALDILYFWLPNNPRVQARVMKSKGLEPFYNQISKLDASVVYKLLDLFNRILEEHVTARSVISNKDNNGAIKLYQKIGLIERTSTPEVCNGLLNIFELIIPFKENEEQFFKLTIVLMKNIKPFCLNLYQNKSRPIKIFTALKKNLAESNINLSVKSVLNSTEVGMLLEDYTKNLNDVSKDEL